MIAPKNASKTKGNPIKILHLEDSLLDHALACSALSGGGLDFEILRVDSLQNYTNACCNCQFDVIVADYNLTGFTAIDAWHATPEAQKSAYILLSGAIGEHAAIEAIKLGIDEYLHKDEINSLGRIILQTIKLKRIAAEKAAAQLELRTSEQKLAAFADHLQKSIDAERSAISREIHDDIGGSLTAVMYDLAWLRRHLNDTQLSLRLDTAQGTIQQALGASQRIMRNLRPSVLDQGLEAATQWLVDRFSRRTHTQMALTLNLSPLRFSKDIELAAYRTIQEALTNVEKHSQCQNIRLDLSDYDGVLTVEVSDDGVGFCREDRQKKTSFGLYGLEERARSVGGWLDISSQKGRGTAIILTVPLRDLNHPRT